MWLRFWHNLRTNRRSELLSEPPLPLVCKWMGNSVEVAAKHYVFSKDSEHNAAAANASATIPVQLATQSDRDIEGTTGRPVPSPFELDRTTGQDT